ncbi:glycine cleavage system aminomethyltransferase GcvT [Pseudogemmobacter faecipullorum]|uniref:aminomethyltransferase n=1 Tax=Pseudogemmobacter faecipullorum TaxID=2755041 RepID=A0ABS8CGN1_9RHOB|nr:glycine cleavage system aminomethyltransferase GcvT [Pseudogemmobacter faecipullorum]MCB5408532.1 glycine cleavage system aminomethyltransferase GcvT [Pseudogemmobacter faecipullorum]
MTDLLRLPLHGLHVSLGGKMVPFAGYEMPVQYPAGVMAEHLHTRSQAGLFDVSHMGQVVLHPTRGMEALALGLEKLMPVDVLSLPPGRQRYGLFTSADGGILDDLMFANRGTDYLLVVNASRKEHDFAHLAAHLGDVARVEVQHERALFALQGPAAEAAFASLVPEAAGMRFMDVLSVDSVFGQLWLSRSGYTGEDGFEISVPFGGAEDLARALLAIEGVMPIGLGARDSLRLEAGLCLYGNDMDETTSPVEAGLGWAIQKARRSGGAREGGFPGAARILRELSEGTERQRVALRPEGRAPMREGVGLYSTDGTPIGKISSGGFGPSVQAPLAIGYVATAFAPLGTVIEGELRGKRAPLTVTAAPFHPHSYKR